MKLILGITTLSLVLVIGLFSAYAQTDSIPTWIKNTALWYSQDEINDDEFFGLIQFLVDNQIITIPNNQDDSQRVLELESKIKQLKRDTVKDIQQSFKDGYKKGTNENQVSTVSKYDSCDESLQTKLITGFASIGIIESFNYLLEYDDDLSNSFSQYHTKILDEPEKYTQDCSGTATRDELSLLAFYSAYLYPEETTEELCNGFIGNTRFSYQDCYDLFKPIK